MSLVAVVGLWSYFPDSATIARADDASKVMMVPVPQPGSDTLKGHEKLSPTLVATKAVNGDLVGTDAHGNPVISFTTDAIEKLVGQPWAKKIQAPVGKWRPVTALMLSYESGKRPDTRELAELGVKLLDEYKAGNFMTVEPLNGRIDKTLIDKLESHAKVQYVALDMAISASQ